MKNAGFLNCECVRARVCLSVCLSICLEKILKANRRNPMARIKQVKRLNELSAESRVR